MNCIVVNDASCLIDLKKGKLLHLLLQLPYEFIVPLPIREEELLDFSKSEWSDLESLGLKTHDLPGSNMYDVLELRKKYSKLSVNDCFALVTTSIHTNSILLTGDNLLRRVAGIHSVRVHGVLWVVDELYSNGICTVDILIDALTIWQNDRSVFLPESEVTMRMNKFKA